MWGICALRFFKFQILRHPPTCFTLKWAPIPFKREQITGTRKFHTKIDRKKFEKFYTYGENWNLYYLKWVMFWVVLLCIFPWFSPRGFTQFKNGSQKRPGPSQELDAAEKNTKYTFNKSCTKNWKNVEHC